MSKDIKAALKRLKVLKFHYQYLSKILAAKEERYGETDYLVDGNVKPCVVFWRDRLINQIEQLEFSLNKTELEALGAIIFLALHADIIEVRGLSHYRHNYIQLLYENRYTRMILFDPTSPSLKKNYLTL